VPSDVVLDKSSLVIGLSWSDAGGSGGIRTSRYKELHSWFDDCHHYGHGSVDILNSQPTMNP
jgi:hypothetical protein